MNFELAIRVRGWGGAEGLNPLLRALFTSFAVINYDYDNNDDDALNNFGDIFSKSVKIVVCKIPETHLGFGKGFKNRLIGGDPQSPNIED